MADPRIAAAIRRATFAAHKAVERLDAAALREVEALYRQAAAEIGALIRVHAGPEDLVMVQEMRSLLAQVEARLQGLGQARDALLEVSLARAADLGVQPFIAPGPGVAVIAPSAAAGASARALEFLRTFIAQDGLQLSDRIWRLDRGARDAVVNQLERSVIEGHGAVQAARELLLRGEALPPELAAKARAADAGRLARASEESLLRASGSPMDNAMRLMRTELNRAHGEAYMMGGEGTPGFIGWRYLLSPAHPEPDICDLLASQNLYGLGPGVYPTRAKTPWPAHPNTLSFIVMVFDDEVGAAERAGRETPLEALKRLPEEKQRGVLGTGKKEIFDAGKLRQGMIRTPLATVKKRISRLEG